MDPALLEILLVLLLITGNGFFAMSEIAVVSARRLRLEQRARSGGAGARTALELSRAPGRFLSTVQLGTTLVGVLAGAIGGATIANRLGDALGAIPGLARVAEPAALATVVLAITYASVVLGEIVPKRIALVGPERIASRVAPAMQRMSRLARPAVSVLSLSSDAVLRLLRVRPVTEPPVTEEEIRLLIERGTLTGAVEPAEREMMERIFRLGDRTVTTIMTPHPDVVWLDLDEPREERLRRISTSGHSHFPVVREKRDNVLGVLHVRDLLAQCLAGRVVDPEAVVQPALFVPETAVASELLERFREAGTHVALVIDEYGSLQGMVTTNDILEAIVGEMPEPREGGGPSVVQREDGSWLVDGALPAEDLVAACGIRELPGGEERRYETVGGLMMTHLGRIPRAGDHFLWSGFRFEVVDMDGRRVDKVLIQPPPPPPNASQAGAGGHP